MKVGVGVTNSKYGDGWTGDGLVMESNVWKFAHNSDQTTIAKDKNKLIKELYDVGCDYIFLFDDDCFPIKPGWEQFFIDACLKTNIQHFSLCTPEYNTPIGKNEDISLYSTGTGCMLFLTRKVVDTVGYFNSAYGKYGYEHCGYSLRIKRAALTPAWYVSVNGWQDYIYSWDLDKAGSKKHGFVKIPARTDEQRLALIAANQTEWDREQNSSQLYYPYAND